MATAKYKPSEEYKRWEATLRRVINRVTMTNRYLPKATVLRLVHTELKSVFDCHPDDPTIRVIDKNELKFTVMITLHKVGKIKMDCEVPKDGTNPTTVE